MRDGEAADRDLTPYPAVNVVARLAHGWLAEALGVRLLGVYLAGSLALGDFDPLTSDIDLIGVTHDAVDDTDLARLAPLRAHLAERGSAWGERVEMAILPLASLARWRPGQRVFFFTGHSAPELATQGPEWTLIRAILRAQGYTIAGPAPTNLLDPVAEDEIVAAARETLRQTWTDYAANQPWYADTRVYQVFVIETMCRALMTIAGGGLPSKPQAMAWAATHLPAEWLELVARARTWRAEFTDNHDLRREPWALPETLAFIRYAVGRAGETEAPGR